MGVGHPQRADGRACPLLAFAGELAFLPAKGHPRVTLLTQPGAQSLNQPLAARSCRGAACTIAKLPADLGLCAAKMSSFMINTLGYEPSYFEVKKNGCESNFPFFIVPSLMDKKMAGP